MFYIFYIPTSIDFNFVCVSQDSTPPNTSMASLMKWHWAPRFIVQICHFVTGLENLVHWSATSYIFMHFIYVSLTNIANSLIHEHENLQWLVTSGTTFWIGRSLILPPPFPPFYDDSRWRVLSGIPDADKLFYYHSCQIWSFLKHDYSLWAFERASTNIPQVTPRSIILRRSSHDCSPWYVPTAQPNTSSLSHDDFRRKMTSICPSSG